MNNKNIIYTLLIFVSYGILLFFLMIFECCESSSNIKDFGDALWYSIVTLATVGYGDIFPVSTGGKVIGAVFVLASIGILSTVFAKSYSIFNELRNRRMMGWNGTDFKNHIVVVGYDDFALSITEILINAGQQVVLITNNKESVLNIKNRFNSDNLFVLFSDYNDYLTMQKAGFNDANIVFVNLKTDHDKLISIINLKSQNPDIKILITLDDTTLKKTFENTGVKYIISKQEIASKLIASYIFEPAVADFNLDVLDTAKSDEDFDVQQFRIVADSVYINKTYGYCFSDIKEKTGALLIGLNKGDKIHKIADDSLIIGVNDYLIVLVNKSSSHKISQLLKVKQGI